ncbi:MAG TPA: hypothetical protein VGG39_37475 [Polyangiaceae bacterium]|jgi:hypothetical protein
METMTKRLLKGATSMVVLAKSQYGTPEPCIEVRFPTEVGYRARSAALHALAAEVEARTERSDTWCVQLEDGNYESGRVWLELVDGTDAEAGRGMALLRRVIA